MDCKWPGRGLIRTSSSSLWSVTNVWDLRQAAVIWCVPWKNPSRTASFRRDRRAISSFPFHWKKAKSRRGFLATCWKTAPRKAMMPYFRRRIIIRRAKYDISGTDGWLWRTFRPFLDLVAQVCQLPSSGLFFAIYCRADLYRLLHAIHAKYIAFFIVCTGICPISSSCPGTQSSFISCASPGTWSGGPLVSGVPGAARRWPAHLHRHRTGCVPHDPRNIADRPGIAPGRSPEDVQPPLCCTSSPPHGAHRLPPNRGMSPLRAGSHPPRCATAPTDRGLPPRAGST